MSASESGESTSSPSPQSPHRKDILAIINVFEKKWAEIEEKRLKPAKKEKKEWVTFTSTETSEMKKHREAVAKEEQRIKEERLIATAME